MKNKILEHMIEQRNGHYCHALELTSLYNLECVIEGLMMDLGVQFTLEDYLEFFNTIELYFIDDKDSSAEHNERVGTELYSAAISELVRRCYDSF